MNDVRGHESVKKNIYENIFNTQFNITFFKPKKDLCVKCGVYKNLSDEEKPEKEQELKLHREEITLSRVEKDKDKKVKRKT